MKLLNRFNLTEKLVFLGVVTAATLAIILAVYFTTTRLNDMYDLLHKTNQNLANSIAESSVNAVFTGNTNVLNTLLDSLKNEPDIVSIKVTDNTGQTLSTVNNPSASVKQITQPAKTITQLIKVNQLDKGEEFDNLLTGNPKSSSIVIGKVTLLLSYDGIERRQQSILINSFYITLLLLLATIHMTNYISKAIGRPILQLAKDVKQISQGDFKLGVEKNDGTDEISTLATGINEMAHEIEEHQNTMGFKISEATRELRHQNQRLTSAQQQIIKSADAKSKFVSHVSHEIRTPLNGIIGFLELLNTTDLTDEQKKLINGSLVSSKNLHQIINEVLDLAQLEAGKIKVKKTDFHLEKTIQETLSILTKQAEDNQVTLEYRHDSNAPEFIHQDPVKFGQVLINLISNAIKFSPNSTVVISLKAHKPKKKHIEICVTDKGPGISNTDIKKLFREFSQLDNVLDNQGTGLGLVITQHILNALNGSINVRSIVGDGSTFCFSLPFTKTRGSYGQLTSKFTESPELPNLSSVRVLVADDNEINRLLLTHLLEKQDAVVTCVNDGQQAADRLSEEVFDLLLLDLRMPFKNGDETLKETRVQPQNPNYKTPAIAITAHITSGVERASHISAFDGYLVKPIDQIEFFLLISKLLSEREFAGNPFTPDAEEKPTQPIDAIFSYEAAKISMNANEAFILIMLNKFFSDLPDQLREISFDMQQNDMQKAAETVHKVHGSAAYCGTPAFKIASKQFEIALREKNTSLIPAAYQQFIDQAEELLTYKDTILKLLK